MAGETEGGSWEGRLGPARRVFGAVWLVPYRPLLNMVGIFYTLLQGSDSALLSAFLAPRRGAP